MHATKAWLFVKGPDTVRIVIDGATVAVYGPAGRFSHSRFTEEMDAALHQAAVEQTLVVDGWTLEEITTERRSSPPALDPPSHHTLREVSGSSTESQTPDTGPGESKP